MTRRWGKLDVGIGENDKFRTLNAASVGIWLMCLSWSAQNETDGFLPVDVVRSKVQVHAPRQDPRRYARSLVDAGLWDEVDDGYMIHDFADYQMTKVQKTEVRAADATRQRRRRAGVVQASRTRRAPVAHPSESTQDVLPVQGGGAVPMSRRDISGKSKRKSERRETSSLVPAGMDVAVSTGRQDAGTLIAEWIDLCGKPPERIKGQMARELRLLLTEYPYETVRAGMLEWIKVGGYGPSALSSFVYSVLNPKNPVVRPSTTNQILMDGAAIIARAREWDRADEQNAIATPLLEILE